MAYGDREQVVFRNFTGIDPRRTGLFPDAFVAQDLIEQGKLLDALNCRFSRGRAYWHRRQLRVHYPNAISSAPTTSSGTTFTRATNVVTLTTSAAHHLATNDKVNITGADAVTHGISGTQTVTGTPTTTKITFANAGADVTQALATCTITPDWPLLCVPFKTGTYDQLLLCDTLGSLFSLTTDWTTAPTQWAQGYAMFATSSWTEQATGLPYDNHMDAALWRNLLMLCGGASSRYSRGMPTSAWSGTALTQVGIETPLTGPTGAADTTAPATGSNALVQGRYSYRVVYATQTFESMPGLITDVDVEETAASGTITAAAAGTVLLHGDSVTVDGQRYRFVTKAGLVLDGKAAEAGDIKIASKGTAAQNLKDNLQALYHAMKSGATLTEDAVEAVTRQTTPLANCDVEWADGSPPVITVSAKATGTAGNSLTLAESTASARFVVSGATLSGGKGPQHIDLSVIATTPDTPAAPAPPYETVIKRCLYRAYTSSLEDGAQGTDWLLLKIINDAATTTYEDNTPQEELSGTIDFDHAMPPRGSMLLVHRDRAWMAGVCRSSPSYDERRTVVTGVRAANVVTITVSAAHTLEVGEWVIVIGLADQSFGGAFRVASTPSTTTFTYAQTGANASSGGGYCLYHLDLSELENVLFFSELGQCFYWPTENRISVGDSTPILGLCSWHDELIVAKSNSCWVVTGYGESDFQMRPIPGAMGVRGNHIAASPYGVLWAGHGGWELFDGESVRQVLSMEEFTNFVNEIEDVSPPVMPRSNSLDVTFPTICWHDERFYILHGDGEYCLCWKPSDDNWEVRRLTSDFLGLRAFNFGPEHSHILATMQWADDDLHYLTVLDSERLAVAGDYGSAAGSSTSSRYSEVRLELPALVAAPGDKINPLEIWIEGRWDVPASDDNDLKVLLSTGEDVAWTTLGTIVQGRKLDVPPGYATARLRLALQGAKVDNFALQAVGCAFQRRTARGSAIS